LTIIPPAAHILFTRRVTIGKIKRYGLGGILLGLAVAAGLLVAWWIGVLVGILALYHLTHDYLPTRARGWLPVFANVLAVVFVGIILTGHWRPLGLGQGLVQNLLFVVVLIGGMLLFFRVFQHFYPRILRWCLAHKIAFLSIPVALIVLGATIWLGFPRVFSFVPGMLRANRIWAAGARTFPGLGREFMPPLDEGSFLYMPTTMPHASIGEAMDVLRKQDMAFQAIPEIESAVGKIGRVESALDPAPISMIETIINYKSEFIADEAGHPIRFRYDQVNGEFARDDQGRLIADPDGRPYRQWRDHVHSPEDIWEEIVKAADIPGTTSAPRLQPIAARMVMLQSGMRAPMGVKVRGPDVESIENVGLQIERFLKEVPGVEPGAVIADRIVGKPYLEIDIDRDAIARYGVSIQQVQDVIEVAIGGKRITTTVEGRERYPVRIRYLRELRDDMEGLEKILIPGAGGVQIPLIQLADIRYVRGPQAIKSENTFLTGYIVFDKKPGYAEVDVVEQAQKYLQARIEAGELHIPPGVHYVFAGSYENQIRAQKTLAVVIPLALFVIFLILYLEFHSVSTTTLVFSGIVVAWSGGFLLIWLYGRPWFLDFDVFGVNLRTLFQVHPINLSVAIWVGFLALFGIASDDGVVMSTYLEQTFRARPTRNRQEIRDAVVEAGTRRVRPCLMTTATTILALIPVLTSTGRGADIMVPMAIPSFGGMTIEILTMLIVPVLYCWIREIRLRHASVSVPA
ncbi:MAG: efflux RND transporter permease subunit, partial [Phycisphaerales bacterium]